MISKQNLSVSLLILFILAFFLAAPVQAQKRDKVAEMKARRAAEGAAKVDKGLTEALSLAGKGNINSWKSAKKKIAEARGALKTLESSAATRDNEDTKKFRATLDDRINEIYMAADSWLPAQLKASDVRTDQYTGSDKGRLSDMIEEAWRQQWPKDKIKDIRFGRKDWNRTVEWGVSSDGQRVAVKDHQILEATVYVQESPNIVTGYPAYINRDNLSESENAGVYTKTSDYISHDVPASEF